MTAPGLRERQKSERRRRIEAAARAVFHEKGYDAATTREIAERAEVSIGTLFAYAADKRDLLTMVYRDELHDLTEATFAAVPPDVPFLDQLVRVLEARFVYWSADPALARHAVRETFAAIYPTGGEVPQGAHAPPEQLLWTRLTALVRANQQSGRLADGDDADLVARVILDIYLSENRAWLAGEQPQLEAGIARLRAALELALRSLILD
ncbi:MAG TPA: helix-turn-helix domain-containing protein [Candidatus Lustribacter sp.]